MVESHSTLPGSFPSPLPPFVPLWLSRSFLLALTFPSFNDANDLMANLLRLGRKESKGRRKRRLEQKAEGIVALLVQINIFTSERHKREASQWMIFGLLQGTISSVS